LKTAIAIAQGGGSALSLYVFGPALEVPLPISNSTASAWLEAENARLETLASTATHLATKAIKRAGLDFIAEHPNSPFDARSHRFVHLARVSDLTILDAVDAADTALRATAEDVLFDSGTPLLLVPKSGNVTWPRRIVIAWDGSARCARAARDALPFLANAELVVAVTVTAEKDLSPMASGTDLGIYLSRHGIGCKLATLVAEQRDAAERLRLFAAEEEIDMIVMGAFVHSRFRQAILGGVTHTLLDQPPVKLLLSH
jgi:nucleotide-binding universal stress UspA family protein